MKEWIKREKSGIRSLNSEYEAEHLINGANPDYEPSEGSSAISC